MAMATENIVLLACAAVLCTLHVVGGPLSGVFRKPPPRKRAAGRAPADRTAAESGSIGNAESEVISRAS